MKFISQYSELRLVKSPEHSQIISLSKIIVPGVSVQFHNGQYETEDEELIDWLVGNEEKGIKPHRGLNVDFFVEVAAADADAAILELAKKIQKKKPKMTSGVRGTKAKIIEA